MSIAENAQLERPTPGNGPLFHMLMSGKYSDLTLRCQGRDFKVHKAILCPRSSVISATCDELAQDGKPEVIKIEHTNYETLQRVLYYLYSDEYDDVVSTLCIPNSSATSLDLEELMEALDNDNRSNGTNGIERKLSGTSVSNSLLHNIRVFFFSERYMIEELKSHAMVKMETAAMKWQQSGYAAVIEEVYKYSEGISLQPLLRKWTEQHAATLLSDEEFLDRTLKIPQFTKDFLRLLVVDYVKQLEAQRSEAIKKEEAATRKVMAMEQETEKLGESIKQAKAQRDDAIKKEEVTCSSVRRMMRAMNDQDECRHCGEDYEPYCDDPNDHPTLMVMRCKYCTTRHYH